MAKSYSEQISSKIVSSQEATFVLAYLKKEGIDVSSDLDRKVLQGARQAYTVHGVTEQQKNDQTASSVDSVKLRPDVDAKLKEAQREARKQNEDLLSKKRAAQESAAEKERLELEKEKVEREAELRRKQELSAQQAAKQAKILKEKEEQRRTDVQKRGEPTSRFGEKKGAKPTRTERNKRFQSQNQDQNARSKRKQKHTINAEDYKQVLKEIAIPKSIALSELAHRMAVKASEVVKKIKELGEIATVNSVLDGDTAFTVVEEFGHKPYEQIDKSIEETLLESYKDTGEEILVARPPVVTVMGHVDHGKTTLLDYIRKANIADKEAGGITQSIGAYSVKAGASTITFIDTPGHVAFSQMRSRGASLTDIVVLVVAANDGLMPQTIEAIEHATKAEVPIVVAINKMDLPDLDIETLLGQLSTRSLVSEDWGGKTQMVQISAKTGENVEKLLEAIQLEAEILELKAAVKGDSKSIVLEASVDPKKGQQTSIIVQSGTLKRGDRILCNMSIDRVRAMFDDDGKQLKEATPGTPVMLLGLSQPPTPGESVLASKNTKLLEQVLHERISKMKALQGVSSKVSLEELFAATQSDDGSKKERRLILKADNKGSLEAIVHSIEALYDDEVKFDIVSQSVGGISESDASLASTLNAMIIGFNVRADSKAQRIIDESAIEIYYYSIIYDLLESVEEALLNLKAPEQRELILGVAEVLDVFDASAFGQVAGCRVNKGIVVKGKPVRILRDDVVIFSGELDSLRREKENVHEVKSGLECGIGVKNYENIKVGDRIEIFDIENIAVKRNTKVAASS